MEFHIMHRLQIEPTKGKVNIKSNKSIFTKKMVVAQNLMVVWITHR